MGQALSPPPPLSFLSFLARVACIVDLAGRWLPQMPGYHSKGGKMVDVSRLSSPVFDWLAVAANAVLLE